MTQLDYSCNESTSLLFPILGLGGGHLPLASVLLQKGIDGKRSEVAFFKLRSAGPAPRMVAGV